MPSSSGRAIRLSPPVLFKERLIETQAYLRLGPLPGRLPGSLGLRNHFVGERSRKLVVVGKTGLERTAPGSYRAQIRCVFENFGHWDQSLDDLTSAFRFHTEHSAAARIKISDDL